ncbi:hypothetical protein P7C70_g5205, partial [Phenoliferia sp. Uapishka_3]
MKSTVIISPHFPRQVAITSYSSSSLQVDVLPYNSHFHNARRLSPARASSITKLASSSPPIITTHLSTPENSPVIPHQQKPHTLNFQQWRPPKQSSPKNLSKAKSTTSPLYPTHLLPPPHLFSNPFPPTPSSSVVDPQSNLLHHYPSIFKSSKKPTRSQRRRRRRYP